MAKIFITLTVVCIFGAVLAEGIDKQAAVATFMAKMEDCKTAVGAKDTDAEELLAKKPASSMEGKCLRACLMKNYEVMDSNGKLIKSVALKHAEKYTDGAADKMKNAMEIIAICADMEVSADHCDAAEEYGKCFKQQAEAYGLTKYEI